MSPQPKNLGELRHSPWTEEKFAKRTVRQELRENLLAKMEKGEPLFPGVHGYDDTVIPQIVNAILSRHHFILLGLRGQAKSRILRDLVGFMDAQVPMIAGCEIHDNPYSPICRACRDRIAAEGDATPISWLGRDHRYVEKLATPDVTIADMIGDVDPIKAARAGRNLSDELTIHYGLLPRANRGVFAINELPDLAGKIQVGLFNIMQEGDVQIKGYPIRMALDVLACVYRESGRLHRARQNHHAFEGPHRLGNSHALSSHRCRGHGDHRTGSLDQPGRAEAASRSRITSAKSWKKWHFRRVKTNGWTAVQA